MGEIHEECGGIRKDRTIFAVTFRPSECENKMSQFEQRIFDLETPVVFSMNLNQILYAVFCITCVVLVTAAIANWKKQGWRSIYFIMLSVSFMMWIFGLLIPTLTADNGEWYLFISKVGNAFVPALIYFHTKKQLHYKKISAGSFIFHLIGPMFYCFTLLMQIIRPGSALVQSLTVFNWMLPLYFVFSVWSFIRTFILCIGVFFHMPRHMIETSVSLIIALASAAVFIYLPYFFEYRYMELLRMIFAAIAVGQLFYSMMAVSSLDVITTSRDFVFESLPTTVLVLSKDERILDWNHKKSNGSFQLPNPTYREPLQQYRRRILSECAGKVTQYSDNTVTIMQDGLERHLTFTSHDIAHDGLTYGYATVITDITDIYSVFRNLEDIAMLDQLTGLYSRNGYMNKAREFLRNKELPLAIIIGDVNGLKIVNDTTGHLVGDALLKCVASSIKTALPEKGMAARIGGDEFVILVPCKDEDPNETAKSLIMCINEECFARYDPEYGAPSVSWGYAAMMDDAEDYNAVFERADTMMYAEKKKHFNFRSSGIVPDLNKKQPRIG